MDQLSTVLNSDLDNFVASEIGTDGGILTALSNNVGFVGLCDFSLAAIIAGGGAGVCTYFDGACSGDPRN